MKKSVFIILISVCISAICAYAGPVYNVRDYGAKGDGKVLDHTAINRAIDACVRNGGGQVVVSAGTYLCGSIHLKSNVDLHLMAGAKILAAPPEARAYDESEYFGGPEYQDGGHTYFHNSLIWAEGQTNISITGCDLGTIDNVLIDTNRDGIDIDCCKFFSVTNTKVNSPSDDAIVLKSSYALKKPVLCEHITITGCSVSGYKVGTLLDGTYVPAKVGWGNGRIKLGTESNAGFRNITISNCTFSHCSGLALEEVDRGRMENIVVSNISMSHVNHYPIYITTGCRNRGPEDCTDISSARDIFISNLVADDVDSFASIIVTGMDGCPVRNVSLSNIRIQYRGGGEILAKPYPEQGTTYPEPLHNGPTPSYGLFARHVDGLKLNNVEFELLSPDARPDVILEDVSNFERH